MCERADAYGVPTFPDAASKSTYKMPYHEF